MTRNEAHALVNRLLAHFPWHLAPHQAELYIDTLEGYPPGCGRMAVGTIEATESRFPSYETLVAYLEREAPHWTTADEQVEDEVTADATAVRAHLAAARAHLEQS